MDEHRENRGQMAGMGRDEEAAPERPRRRCQCYLLSAMPGVFLPSFLRPLFLLPARTPSSKGA